MAQSSSLRILALLAPVLVAGTFACGGDSAEQRPRGAPAPGAAPAVEVEIEPASDVEPGEQVAIQGLARFEGQPPPRQPLAISGMAGCQHDGPPPLTEAVVVSEGRLQNAIVYVSRGVPDDVPPAPAEAVHLDQLGCVYRPHVTALQVGQELRVSNSDPTSHNVRVHARRTSVPNRTQAAGGQDLRIVFEAAEPPVKIGCDIHPWMGAWVGVFDHPFFAVTGADGSFRIDGLPPGRYTLTAWHESFERATAELDLAAGGTAVVEFTYAAR